MPISNLPSNFNKPISYFLSENSCGKEYSKLKKNSKNLKFFREQICQFALLRLAPFEFTKSNIFKVTQRRVVYVVFILILYYMFYCVFPSIINITCFYEEMQVTLLIHLHDDTGTVFNNQQRGFFNFIILSLIVFQFIGPMWNRQKIGNSAKY
uniref:Uncharacterized protein n=1 Tax=Heterorhabditis bacteriophora TaxID=37862 RepID=A0A1I7WBA4_HETBA